MTTETIGTLEEAILAQVRKLPPERQQQVLDFVRFLKSQEHPVESKKSAEGLWADLDLDISDEAISEARREMWGSSSRAIER